MISTRFERAVAALAGVLVLFLSAGCGDGGPELAGVTGTVTLGGKPVANAEVTFLPQEAGAAPSYARTDSQGDYVLMYTRDKAGARVGKHDVRIKADKISKEEAVELIADGEPVPEFVPIPNKYAERGALFAEVESGENDIDFQLDAK